MKYFVVVLLSLTMMMCAKSENPSILNAEEPVDKSKDEKVSPEENIRPSSGVDILFVVDDSGSMGSHQSNLARFAGDFVAQLKHNTFLNYHIGITTTSSYDNGRLKGSVPFVTPTTPSGLIFLQEAFLRLGVNGDYIERHFEPVIWALSEPNVSGHNKGFYREDANLAIIFISDAEDQSTTIGNFGLEDFLINQLKKGNSDLVVAYGGLAGANNCYGEGTPPITTEQLIANLGGTAFSLCDPDLGTKIAEVARDIRRRVKIFLPLAQPPAPDTIVVKFGKQVIPRDPIKGWWLDSERIGLVMGPQLVLDFDNNKANGFTVTYEPADLGRD